jgi:rabenosyn-5
LLVVGDYKLGRCEEVEEGFVGWLKVDTKDAGGGGQRRKGTEKEPMVNGDGAEKEGGKGSEEIKIQGVRICRTCWAVVS